MNAMRAMLMTVVVVAGVGAVAGSALSAVRTDVFANRVAIGCQIENEKVLVLVNTTASAIPAGTRLSWDAILKPNQQHQAGSLMLGAALQPGRVVKKGLSPAFSCTASFLRQLLLAPSP